ncbi:hypothetical protein U9M48_041316 [Paspalum notatum var. saurae]|uniref:Uncharacterized protein n=1 Tax=Paspalum notatum var. saurae TaxID=547442 RepID=A0AAQ3XD76_PASNO
MSTDAYARHRDEALAGAVQGGNPFSMTEQLEGLTRANEGFLSMMQAWGYLLAWKLHPSNSHQLLHSKQHPKARPIDGGSIHVVHADGSSSTNIVPTYGYSIFAADGSSCVHTDPSTGNRI